MNEENPAKLEQDVGDEADKLEHQADDMQERAEALGEDADNVRQDWERKRRDPNVPGAPEPEEDTGKSPADAER